MLKEGVLADGFKIQILRAKSSEPDCLKLFRLLSNSIIFGTMWLCRKGEHTSIYQKDQAEPVYSYLNLKKELYKYYFYMTGRMINLIKNYFHTFLIWFIHHSKIIIAYLELL